MKVTLDKYLRPSDGSRLGLHWTPVPGHAHSNLTPYLDKVQAMGVRWVTLLDDGGGSTLQPNEFYGGKSIVDMFMERDVIPIIRIFAAPDAKFDMRFEDTTGRLVQKGVRYIFWMNEPECAGEWEHRGRKIPKNWVEITWRNFVEGAYKMMKLGAYPGTPAVTTWRLPDPNGVPINPFLKYMTPSERDDIFINNYGWVPIHNYPKNHPIDYPFDEVNLSGRLMTAEEYQAILAEVDEGYRQRTGNRWVFDNYQTSEHHINFLRERNTNPGATLEQDDVCFLMYKGMNRLLEDAGLLPYVPVISTEIGPCVGERDDGRYPRMTPQTQIKMIDAMLDEAGEVENYFAMTFWLAGVQLLHASTADGFEDQSWWTVWHNEPFKLQGELPIVTHLIDKAQGATTGVTQPHVGETESTPVSPGTGTTNETEPTGRPEGGEGNTTVLTGLPPIENDAAAYGLRIVPAQVKSGDTYWRIVKVHHLTPQENNGLHHLFVDLIDEEGQRLFHEKVGIFLPNNISYQIIIEKPLGEPGSNHPLYNNDNASAQALSLPSDRIENVNTNHDDEGPGNTRFHHSFLVVWQRTRVAAARSTVAQPAVTRAIDTRSKLCPHIQFFSWNVLDAIKRTQPPMIKTMDLDRDVLRTLRKHAPNSLLVARLGVDGPTQDRYKTDPVGAAMDYAEQYKPVLDLVDVVEVFNEAVFSNTPKPEVDHFDLFQETFAHRIWQMNANVKIGLFCLATGHFGWPNENKLTDFPRSLALPRDRVYLCFHEYSWPNWDAGAGALCLRYRKLVQGLVGYKVLITECGLTHGTAGGGDDGWRSGIPRQVFVDGAKWYDSEIRKDSYVVGAALFNCGPSTPEWTSFECTAEWEEAAQAAAVVPIEPEKPSLQVEWLNYTPPDKLLAGEANTARLKLRNIGTETWWPNRIQVGYRWYTLEGDAVPTAQDLRTMLPVGVAPGMLLTLAQVQICPPNQPGEYILKWDLIEDGVAWFESQGSPTYDFQVTVSGARRATRAVTSRSVRIGLHGRDQYIWTDGDFQVVQQAKIETVKMMGYTQTAASVQLPAYERLRRENPGLEFIVRLRDDRIRKGNPSHTGHPTPEEFAASAIPLIDALKPFAVKFEIHNEPNHGEGIEGWGSSDLNAQDFRQWYLDVLRRLKAACPWASFGFPGLAVPSFAHRDLDWLDICRDAVLASDWLGCHTYWQGGNMLNDDWGLVFKKYNQKFPNKVIEITEFGDSSENPPVSGDVMAQEYVTYYQELFKYPYLGSASAFIISSHDPKKPWERFVWRKESGEVRPVVPAVGQIPRPNIVHPTVVEPKPLYRITWLDYQGTAKLQAGRQGIATLKFKNDGTATWKAGQAWLGYTWINPNGGVTPNAGSNTTALPADIAPGNLLALKNVAFTAPAQPGTYRLRWDLIDQAGIWFVQKGSAPYDVTVTVEALPVSPDRVDWLECSMPPKIEANNRGTARLKLRNSGASTWNPAQVKIGCRWYTVQGESVSVAEDMRTNLPAMINPGMLVTLTQSQFTAPAQAGDYVLKWDLIADETEWFEDKGSTAFAVRVWVNPAPGAIPTIEDITDQLPKHPTLTYPTRELSKIKNLVVHHTDVPVNVPPAQIARYHIETRGWAGIAYHFLIMADGMIYQTNKLETISAHAQSANPSSVAVTFAGKMIDTEPTAAQLQSGGWLLAKLIRDLSLTPADIKGHKDFVATTCPGNQWETGLKWRDKLVQEVKLALQNV